MAGSGPPPMQGSATNKRRTRQRAAQMRVIEVTPCGQPPLPDGMGWCPETVEWWRQWGESPLMADATQSDWQFLLDTAILHNMLWANGDTSVLAELRIRVAKFGATPEDRARLRIQFATAEKAEDGRRRAKITPAAEAARRRRAV